MHTTVHSNLCSIESHSIGYLNTIIGFNWFPLGILIDLYQTKTIIYKHLKKLAKTNVIIKIFIIFKHKTFKYSYKIYS
jgi:hypothetical protein